MPKRSGAPWSLTRNIVVGALLLGAAPGLSGQAFAAKVIRHHGDSSSASGSATRTASTNPKLRHGVRFSHARYNGGARLQCVTFARAASGIEIKGNAVNWWDAAAGVYERGNRPEPGSVLNFRSTGRMRLGHVAVVREVVDSRQIVIDHANWSSRGSVTRGIPVIDVSPNNDWTSVRVGLGHSGDYGSVYPTYGFIYDRADRGTVMASAPGFSPTVMSIDELTDGSARVFSKRHVGSLATDPNLLTDAPSRALR